MLKWIRRFALALAILAAAGVRAQLPPSSPLVLAALQAQREALFDGGRIDVSQMSRDIGLAVRESEQLEREGRYQQALDRLKALELYVPLRDFPSFDVHMLASWLYDKLGQPDARRHHQERAAAYREFLWTHLGKGDRPEDPLRVVMVNEAIEWAKSRLARITDVKAMPSGLTVLTYAGSTTDNQPRALYMQIDSRTQAIASRSFDRFAPIPVSEMRPQDMAWLTAAQEKRERFLADRSFQYHELEDRVRKVMQASFQSDKQGKPQEALATLREVEKTRPIAEIPTPHLLAWYSYLLGKNGQTVMQQETRGLIFGVQQAIAHSGDGLSAATAVQVVLVAEEYEWLRDKKLKTIQQTIRDEGGRHYDVMTVEDAQGRRSEVFFDVTKLLERRLAPAMPVSGLDRRWPDAQLRFA